MTGEEHGGLQVGGSAQAEAVGSGYEGIAAGRADAKAMTARARAEVEKCMTVAEKGGRGRGRTEGQKAEVVFMKGAKRGKVGKSRREGCGEDQRLR